MNRPEQALQRAVARYLDLALPDDAWWTAIPAGGGGRRRGAILKGIGYQAGTPDILIVWKGAAHWIEMKAPRGKVSAEQKAVMAELAACGSPCEVCRSLEDVDCALRGWGLPVRLNVR